MIATNGGFSTIQARGRLEHGAFTHSSFWLLDATSLCSSSTGVKKGLLTSFVVMALNGAAKFNKICPIIISAIERMLVPDDNAVTPRQWQYLFQDVYALTHARPKSFSEELHTSLSEFVASHFHKQCQVAFAMFDSTTISNAQLHIRL